MSVVLQKVRDMLTLAGVSFAEKHHEPTFTSEESARARGEALAIGAKALVVKGDDRFLLLVLPADRKLDSSAVKRHLGARKLRFADKDELLQLTGLVPGSVPPFGEPIVPLPLIADPALLENERVAFNAGSLTDSIIMNALDYERVANAHWVSISSS
jgi:Ala-tRNA(Pro) deacylase